MRISVSIRKYRAMCPTAVCAHAHDHKELDRQSDKYRCIIFSLSLSLVWPEANKKRCIVHVFHNNISCNERAAAAGRSGACNLERTPTSRPFRLYPSPTKVVSTKTVLILFSWSPVFVRRLQVHNRRRYYYNIIMFILQHKKTTILTRKTPIQDTVAT